MKNTDHVKLNLQLSNGMILKEFETSSFGCQSKTFEINEYGEIIQEGESSPINFTGTVNVLSSNSTHEYDIFFFEGIAGSMFDSNTRHVFGYPKKLKIN